MSSAFKMSPYENPVMFMGLSNKTIVNSTTETSALPTTFFGSKTIPANRLKASTTINIQGGGIYSIPLLTPGTVTVKVKIGNTVVASSVVGSLTGAITDGAFQFDCSVVVRTTGASGTVAPVGGLNFAASAGARVFSDLVNGGADAVVNTTIANDVEVTLQWQTASTSRSITVRGALITLTN